MRVPSLDTLRDAARSVAAAAGYDLVAVFGSVARGDAGAHDLDLGITSSGPVDLLDATNRFVVALGVGGVVGRELPERTRRRRHGTGRRYFGWRMQVGQGR